MIENVYICYMTHQKYQAKSFTNWKTKKNNLNMFSNSWKRDMIWYMQVVTVNNYCKNCASQYYKGLHWHTYVHKPNRHIALKHKRFGWWRLGLGWWPKRRNVTTWNHKTLVSTRTGARKTFLATIAGERESLRGLCWTIGVSLRGLFWTVRVSLRGLRVLFFRYPYYTCCFLTIQLRYMA